MIPAGSGPTKVRLVISRSGGRPVVLMSLDQSEDEGDDPLNNSVQTTETYSPKAGSAEESEILCARYYETDPEGKDQQTGTVTHDRPRLAFPTRDVQIQPEEEDRIEYDGRTYELGVPRYHPTFATFEAKNVDE